MLALGALTACGRGGVEDRDWPAHGGDPGHPQYSPLEQITPQNMNQLQVAWTYRTGESAPTADPRSSAIRLSWTACPTEPPRS